MKTSRRNFLAGASSVIVAPAAAENHRFESLRSPFKVIEHRLHCACGNHPNDKKYGFETRMLSCFVSPDEEEKPSTIFATGLVAMNLCTKCGASYPLGGTN